MVFDPLGRPFSSIGGTVLEFKFQPAMVFLLTHDGSANGTSANYIILKTEWQKYRTLLQNGAALNRRLKPHI